MVLLQARREPSVLLSRPSVQGALPRPVAPVRPVISLETGVRVGVHVPLPEEGVAPGARWALAARLESALDLAGAWPAPLAVHVDLDDAEVCPALLDQVQAVREDRGSRHRVSVVVGLEALVGDAAGDGVLDELRGSGASVGVRLVALGPDRLDSLRGLSWDRLELEPAASADLHAGAPAGLMLVAAARLAARRTRPLAVRGVGRARTALAARALGATEASGSLWPVGSDRDATGPSYGVRDLRAAASTASR